MAYKSGGRSSQVDYIVCRRVLRICQVKQNEQVDSKKKDVI